MNEQELSRLLIRIAGVVIATYGMILLPHHATYILAWLNQPIERAILLPQFWLMTLAPAAVCIIAGALLSYRGAHFISPPSVMQDNQRNRKITAAQLEQTALAVLGVYFVVDGAASALRQAGMSLSFSLQSPEAWLSSLLLTIVSWLSDPSMISDAAQIAIGLWLMFRGHVIVSLRHGIASLRTMGRD